MKPKDIKKKVAAKVSKSHAKVAKKCGKAKACALWLVATAALSAIVGCATVDQPNETPNLQAGKSETMNATLNNSPIYVMLGVKKLNLGSPTNSVEFGESAETKLPPDITILGQVQSLESSGTETYSPSNAPVNTPTATPTNDVKPQTTLTYGLASSTPAGAAWVNSLDEGCAKLLSSWLGTGRANGTMEVTKKDGSKETVTCKDGVCTTSGGECITCSEGACADGNCSEGR